MYTSAKTRKKRRHVGPTCLKIPGENTAHRHTHMYAQHTHTHTHMYVCTSHTHVHTTHTHVCTTHTHTHTHVHTHTHTHSHTHTHTYTNADVALLNEWEGLDRKFKQFTSSKYSNFVMCRLVLWSKMR